MASPIKVLALADYKGRSNLNPVRPEAAQLLYAHQSGEVEVTVMCSPDSVLVGYYSSLGIEVITHDIVRKVSLESIKFIRELVKSRGFHIVHMFNSRNISNGTLALIGLKAKALVYRGQPGSLRRYDPISYLNALSPRVDKIICVSKAVEDYMHEQLGANSMKPVTIYKGHDLSWYNSPPADLSDLDLPENAFTVCMVANLRPHKGLHVLVDATHHLPDEAPIYFILLGSNTDGEEVKKMIATAAHPERFRTLGYRNDAPEVAAACDMIVLPTTKREGLPRAVIEAMAYARPAVVSNSGGNAELVADGESGYVVPVESPPKLARGIERLWKDPEQRKAFGLEAQRRIRDIFNVEQGAKKTLDVYRELAADLAREARLRR